MPGVRTWVTWTSSMCQPSTPTLASFWKRKRKRRLRPARAPMLSVTWSICGYDAFIPCQAGSPPTLPLSFPATRVAPAAVISFHVAPPSIETSSEPPSAPVAAGSVAYACQKLNWLLLDTPITGEISRSSLLPFWDSLEYQSVVGLWALASGLLSCQLIEPGPGL